MQSVWNRRGKKVHTRTIEVSTYEHDGQRIIVEGVLRDERFQESHILTGETFPAGVVHNMVIRLLVNCSSLLIEDVDVELKAVPREVCRETIDCLAQIKGMTIARGFTSTVKRLAGGKKGCVHLVELIQAMAPAAFQGFGAHQSQKPLKIDPERVQMMSQFLINTCRTWREDGPYVEIVKKKLNMQ